MSDQSVRQAQTRIEIDTSGTGFFEFTNTVNAWLRTLAADQGLLTVFVRHTSASLVIQENADRDVQADLLDALSDMAPEDKPYRHASEGPDDMPAHIKAMVTATSLSIPVAAGSMMLGTWQGLYIVEHRSAAHRRQVILHFTGTLGDLA